MVSWVWLFIPGAVFLSGCLTGAARWCAPKIGLVDRPDAQRKRHARPTPCMGGVAIFGTFLVLAGVAQRYIAAPLGDEIWARERITLLLLCTAGFCALGLADDRWSLRARHKFLLQIVACLPFVIWARTVDTVSLFGLSVPLGMCGPAFTIFWLVACSNVINLVDGLDGLAGSVGLVATVTIAALSAMTKHHDVAVVSLIAAGSLAGFLIHNWPPAKIFMGDSGSLPLGFLIGALSLESSVKQAAGFTLVAPLVLISIPVFDTSMAILRRKLLGKSIGTADRGHIHHRLQDRGLTRLQALLSLAGLCVIMAGVAVASVRLKNDLLAVVLCSSVLAAIVVARVFGHDEVGLFMSHLRALGTLIADTSRLLPLRLLTARMQSADIRDRDVYWMYLCDHVARMGGMRLEFRCRDALTGRPVMNMTWSEGEPQDQPRTAWEFNCSVRRDDEVESTISVAGVSADRRQVQRLDELFRLFEAFCRHWPADGASAESATTDLSATAEAVPRILAFGDAPEESAEPRRERRAA